MQYRVDTLTNRFNYLDRLKALDRRSWPEFLCHGNIFSWNRIYEELADFVLLWIDADDFLAGAGFTIPMIWNGRNDDLPTSIESIIQNGLNAKGQSPNTLMAIAALVDHSHRGQGLSAQILKHMTQLAQRHDFRDLVVPVRPTWKPRYPLQPIEIYASWKRADGLYYDPWLRTHQRLGATMLACVDSTLEVEGSIADWQTWTDMVFPESGHYIVEGALQPVVIDVVANSGVYHDPNVWMRHKLS